MVINQCNKIHINPKTESILKVQKQVVKLVHYIKDQTVQMVGEKVHYLKKNRQVLEGSLTKFRLLITIQLDETIRTKKCPRDDWLETVDLKYRYTIIGCLKSNNQRRKPTGIINTCQTSLDFLRIPAYMYLYYITIQVTSVQCYIQQAR